MVPAAWFLVLFLSSHGGFGVTGSVTALPFNTREGCEAAATAIERKSGYAHVQTAVCIPGDALAD